MRNVERLRRAILTLSFRYSFASKEATDDQIRESPCRAMALVGADSHAYSGRMRWAGRTPRWRGIEKRPRMMRFPLVTVSYRTYEQGYSPPRRCVAADRHVRPSMPRLKAWWTSATLPHRFSGSFSIHPKIMDSNQSGTDELISLGGAAKIFEC